MRSWWPSGTPVAALRRSISRTSSIHSSPPNRAGSGPASASRSRTAWSGSTTGPSACTRCSGRGPSSRFTCRDSPPAARPHPDGMASILIIDDEVAIATAFAMFFRHDGAHQVTEAYTGQDGIDAYRRIRPDLVLLDVRLPDMTGFDVLAAIREDHPVVVMVTAYGDVPMAVDALHKGAENFLTKPVDLSHLAAAAERALEKASLRRLSRWLTTKRGSGKDLVFGNTVPMRELQAQIQLLAGSDRTTALVLGE